MSKVTQQTEILGLVNDKFGSTITTTDVSIALLSTDENGKAVVSITPAVDSKYYGEDEVNYLKRHLGKYFTGIKLVLDLKPEELTFGALLDKLVGLYGLDIDRTDITNPDGAILYTDDMPDLAVDLAADGTSLTWDGTLQLKVRGYWNSIERMIPNRDMYGLTYLVGDGDLPLQILTNTMNFTDVTLLATLKADDVLTAEQVTTIQKAIGQRTAAGIMLEGGDPVWAEDGLYKLGTATVAYNGPVADAEHATSTTLPNVCVLTPGDDALGVGGYVLLAYADVADVAPESYSLSFSSDGTDFLLMMHSEVWDPSDFVYPTGDLTGTLGDGTPIELQWLYDETYTGGSTNPALITKTPLPAGVHKIDFKYDGPMSTSNPYPNAEHPWAKLTAVWQWGDITTENSYNFKLTERPEFTTVGKYFSRLLGKFNTLSDIFNGSNVYDIHPNAFDGFVNVNSASGLISPTTEPVVLKAGAFFGLKKLVAGQLNGAFGYESTISRVEGQVFDLDDKSSDMIFAIYGNNGAEKLEYLHPAALDGLCEAPTTVYSPFVKSQIKAADVAEDFYDRWAASLINIDGMWSNSKDLDYVPMMHKRIPNLERLASFVNGNPLITEIPANTFEGMTKLQYLSYGFSGTSITTVPADLFAPCAATLVGIGGLYANTLMDENSETGLSVLTVAGDAGSIWQNCKMSKLPAHALPPSPELYNIAGAFNNNPNLLEVKSTDVDMSMYTKLNNVSALFTNCSALTDVSTLTTLPVNANAKDLGQMFSGCTALVNIPLLDIFRAFPNTYQMGSMLSGSGYAADSADIVLAIQQLAAPAGTTKFNCYQMFANTKITGKGADIIAALNAIKTGGNFSGIFRGCTTLSDYASLPAAQK